MANLPRLPFAYTAGDTRPAMTGTLPYDLEGHTITMTVKRPDGTLLTKTAALDDYDDDDGTTAFSFEWDDDDLQVGSNQVCQVFDTDADGARLSSPKFFLDVAAAEASS